MRAAPRLGRRLRCALSAPAAPVASGVVVLGLSTYGYFMVATRQLTPEGFAGVSVVYTVLYVAGAGLLQPVEAYLSRSVASGQTLGQGSAAVVRRTAAACAVGVSLLAMAVLWGRASLADAFFGGDQALVVASVLGLAAFAGTYVARGVLAGTGRFRAYGAQLALEGVLRLAAGGVLAASGARSAAPYALLVALAPALATLLVIRPARTRLSPGAGPGWRATAAGLAALGACGIASQSLANAGPVLVAFLGSAEQYDDAGRFMAALVLVRVPLFLFSAVQAVLVPTVATAVAQGRLADVRRSYVLLTATVAVAAAVNVGCLAAIGPQLLTVLFGSAYAVPRLDLVLLGCFAAAQLHAQLSYQTLLGLGAVRSSLASWLVGLALVAVGTAFSDELIERVEAGLLLGALAAAVLLAGVATRRTSTGARLESPSREHVQRA